jgi:hypothetical protein
MKWVAKENVHTNRIHQKWMLEKILALQCRDGEKKPSFQLYSETIDRLNELLLKHRRIHYPINIEKLKGGTP